MELEMRDWKVPYPLTGNAFFFGRIGSGKTWKMLAIAQSYYDKGMKILDFCGGKREEGPFWAFKSDEGKLWFDFEQEVGNMSEKGPKEYPVHLVKLMWSSNLKKNVPENLPTTKTSIITIFFKDIIIQDISMVVGALSSNAVYLWNSIVNELDDNANGEDILDLIDRKFVKHKELAIYKLFIKPFCDNHVFAGKNGLLNLDLIEEAKDTRTVTVLWQEGLPKEIRLFFMWHILRTWFDLVLEDKIPKNNIALGREASEYMKVQDKNKQGEDQTQAFRNGISDIARYSRSGFYLFLDCQSPSEVRGLIEGQDDLLGINEMPSQKDREAICDKLKEDNRMSNKQIAYLSMMPTHQMLVVTRGQKAKIIRRIQPPRTKCWKPGDGNFMTEWKKRVNKYRNYRIDMGMIEDEYEERKYKIIKSREKSRLSKESITVTLNDDDENKLEEIRIQEEADQRLITQLG